MKNTIMKFLNNVRDGSSRFAIQRVVNPLADRYGACMLGSAGIIISGAAAVTAKTGAVAVLALANNSIAAATVSIAASTVLTPVGTTLINTFNVYVFYVDNAGVITTSMGTPATTLGAVVWPLTPIGKAIVGGFTVNPTSASFVAGTTALDAAATNVVYFSPTGAFDPTVLTGATVTS